MVGAVPLAAAPTAAGRMNGVTPVPGETAATSFVQPPAANVVTSNSQAEPAVMATSVRAEVITVAAPLAAGSGQSTKVTAQPSVPNGLSVPNGHAAAVPAVAAAVLRTESEPASTVENVWTRLEAMAAEGTKLKARYEKLEVRLASKELELQRLKVLLSVSAEKGNAAESPGRRALSSLQKDVQTASNVLAVSLNHFSSFNDSSAAAFNRGRRGRGRGRRGRGRGRGRKREQLKAPGRSAGDSRPAAYGGASVCVHEDEALLRGSTCSLESQAECPIRYILLRVHGNDKYLAPREKNVVYAAVRARFKEAGEVPLQRIAWKLIPQARGWVQLQHVLTGKYLRLLPPSNADAWVFVVVADAESYGKETWFQLQSTGGQPVDAASSLATVHLRSHVSGAFLNYRGEDFIRGHGNSMRAKRWQAADRLPSTRLGLTSLGLPELQTDIARWAERKQACLAPCRNATAAAADAASGISGWRDFCWKHFAEPLCNSMARAHHVLPGISWGSLPELARLRWARMDCELFVSAAETQRAVSPQKPLPRPQPRIVVDDIGSLHEGAVHCVPAVEGVLLIAVADRPNQFLCHFFSSALRHGLKPVVLGWNPNSWLDVTRKPWTYHLGAKLLLPLHYLQQCRYPEDTLVVFTDQDVVFQGGYSDLKQAYARSSASANHAPLIFSSEKESYPLELQGL